MTRVTDFRVLIRELQYTKGLKQCEVLKDIATALHEGDNNVLQELLELLISTYDTDVQTKIFSVLAAYLINNGVYYEEIVKYNPLYETIRKLLVRGLPAKAAVILNFMTALFGRNDDDGLATHARNMIRVSGCLDAISHMFSSSMVYHDTWIALCQSLAEACRNSQVNQSYCTHLVSLCVQRCRLGNVDVCTVLQSLLENHERNIQLFIESEGLTIFTRSVLQYNMGMQLLSTIAEKSPTAVSMLRTSRIVQHLRDFLHMYGPNSVLGQWSTIVLYHLDKGGTIGTENNTEDKSQVRQEFTKTKDKENHRTRDSNNRYIDDKVGSKVYQNPSAIIETTLNNDKMVVPNPDDTTRLFQNVMKEVLLWKSKENVNVETSPYFNSVNNIPCDYRPRSRIETTTKRIQYKKNITKQIFRENAHEEDLSFSSLVQHTFQNSIQHYRNSNTKDKKEIETIRSSSKHNATSYYQEVPANNSNNFAHCNESRRDSTFTPAFISTPKCNRIKKNNVSKVAHRSRVSSRQQASRFTTKLIEHPTQETRQNDTKNTKHRSMSERIFNAINESCTTIVKGVKNMFRPKENKLDGNTNENHTKNISCSYSFTNYMRKRDALLEGDFSCNDYSNSGNYKVDSCRTCKDTIVLQQKMKRDDNLKRTVRKLKLGINLYGCDFKKISYAMWPNDRYMTSNMLYNLYRKLIVKGGHDNHSFRLRHGKFLETDNYYRKRSTKLYRTPLNS